MALVLTLLLLFFSFVLIKSTDMVVVALRRISRSSGARIFALSALIMALGTSIPELFVGIVSAFEGVSSLSMGNVMGSNIANISLVAGMSALFAGKVIVRGDYLRKDVLIASVAGFLPLLLVLDGSLSRIDGFILLAIYGAYASSFFKERFEQIAREQQEEESFFYRFFRRLSLTEETSREYGKLFVGIALLLLSADLIVTIAKFLAQTANLPVFLIGLVVLSIGTTLPELAFSLRSLIDREPGMFFGNILGSIITNSTLVFGLSSSIRPFQITKPKPFLIAAFFFLIVFGFFWFFIRSKHRLDRWEAAFLLILYIIFLIVEFI